MSAVTALSRSLVEKWPFTRAMALRDLKGLNKGSVLGVAWLVARPLIQVAAYVFIVSFVFGARLSPTAGPFDYALHVLSGLIAWQAVQQALEAAPSLMRERMEIVKQIAYPVETLPLSTLLTTSVGPLVALTVYVVLAGMSGRLPLSILLLPVPAVLLAALLIGLSWLFMLAGVLLKDLREIVSVLLGLCVYLSPVLLTREMVGPRLWGWMMLNPLAHVVIAFRDVLAGGFHPFSWAVFATSAVASFAAGAIVLQRTKVLINEYL